MSGALDYLLRCFLSKLIVQGDARQFCSFHFEVPWVSYNVQFLTIFIYLRLSCHHKPALKGLLGNCKTEGCPQTWANSSFKCRLQNACTNSLISFIISVFSIFVMALRSYQSEVCFTHLFRTLFSKVSGESGPRPVTIFSKSPIKLYFLE